MLATIETYVRLGRGKLRQWVIDPRLRLIARGVIWFGSGMILSAAALTNRMLPLTLSLLLVLTGWKAVLVAAGGCAGYWLFWGQAGQQGAVWLVLGLPVALLLGRQEVVRQVRLLMPAIGSFLTAAAGLGFQIFLKDDTGVGVYLLRVGLSAGVTLLFQGVRDRQDPVMDWAAQGIGVLALAQLALFPGGSLGYLAAGCLAVWGSFPAAALGGLALDLARISSMPMTAVMCLAYLTRLSPWGDQRIRFAAPALVYGLMMGLCGFREPLPMIMLALGGGLALLLPTRPEVHQRRGETGLAQVRLELMASCLAQTQHLLLEAPTPATDEEALVYRARERACGGCPCRKGCAGRNAAIPPGLLEIRWTENTGVPFGCKKSGRMILELRRAQDQLRIIRADHKRQTEYREAVAQQYRFLSEFLQQQADQLPRRRERMRQRYQPDLGICSAGKETVNGDRCLWFSGPGCRYYILLCDGMGTGLGAAQEGQTAAGMLRQMLSAGFPAEHALRSVNSLCCLRGRAGAVTMDLAELHLDSGTVMLYKWGAAPSFLLTDAGAEKIGTAGPPPGLSVTQGRETVDRLSLRRGEVLIMVSDGVEVGEPVRRMFCTPNRKPGEMAAAILERGAGEREDDATVAVVQLIPGAVAT